MKKEEITSSVPSDEEALEKFAQEVDKELAQRGISPKVPMATVDISSSDNGSSDEEDDVSEGEETKGEDDSQRHNTEDGELAESDETSMTESDDEDDSPHRGPVIKSRMLRKAISGYGEGESDASSSPDQPRQRSVTPPPAEATPEDATVDEKPVAEPLVEETIDTPVIDPNLPAYYPALYGCRNVEEYEWLNRIEEGTYGVVYRAKDKRTGEVVALKKLKMEKEKEGFPITSLREINTLLKSHHPNIINVREVVFSKVDKIFIVMDYVEHDLKSLMETMKQPFLEGEVKTLLRQLLSAVEHMHDNWILHRDIKTSNLLLGHNGILRVGDFGLAREYGSPLKGYTPIVVTLWYRAPELLLGAKEYSTAVDIWSVGCVFAELLLHKALFKGKSEIDQLNQIFKELGTPNDKIWPGYSELPCVKKVSFKEQPFNNLRKKFPYLTKCGFDLLNRFLTYDPKKRITAEDALAHEYFKETPLPVDPSMFPTWPAKSELAALKKDKTKEKSPSAPEGGAFLSQVKEDDPVGGFRLTTAMHGQAAVGQGFSLRF